MIPVYRPYPSKDYFIRDALKKEQYSSGTYNIVAEKMLESILKVKHVLLTNNGTSATFLIAKALKYKYKNCSRIAVPSNCYIAAVNMMLEAGFEIVPIKCNSTGNISLFDLAKKKDQFDCILIVHNLGKAVNVPKIKKWLDVPIIEDNCEGFMNRYPNSRFLTGTKSLCSSLSFYGNKLITCGEGGAVVTDDDELYEYMKKLRGQGQTEIRFIHDVLGYNFRLTNIQAALLCEQINVLPEIIVEKEKLRMFYKEQLKDLLITLHMENRQWMFGFQVAGGSYGHAEEFFKERGVEVRPMFYPIDIHEHLKKYSDDYKEEERLNSEMVLIPSSPALTQEEREKVVEVIKEYVWQFSILQSLW